MRRHTAMKGRPAPAQRRIVMSYETAIQMIVATQGTHSYESRQTHGKPEHPVLCELGSMHAAAPLSLRLCSNAGNGDIWYG